jgi:predicted metal-dependent hydrolase
MSQSSLLSAPWLTVRRNRRARRLRLRVMRNGEVVLVAPPRASHSLLEEFVSAHRTWIEATRSRILDQRGFGPEHGEFPPGLALRAVDRTVAIQYVFNASRARFRWLDDGLVLDLCERNAAAARAGLIAALRHRARIDLEPRLAAWAERHGLRYERVGWRNQQSRWGSCSSKGSISLNLRLLFLPPALVDYVLVHELAHLEHPNHSPRFWARVDQMLPETPGLRLELRQADRYLPGWV